MSELLNMSAEETESYARELVARLGLDIAKEEQKFLDMRERLEKMVEIRDEDGRVYLEEQIKEAYHRMRMATEPMRREREYVIKQICSIEMFKLPPIIALEAKEK